MPALVGQSLDTSRRGLLRLYFCLVMSAAGAVLLLHAVVGFLTGFGDQFGPFLMGVDALLLLLAYVGYELSSVPDETRLPQPRYGIFVIVGIFTVLVCAETGGLASPFFMLVLATSIFAALTMNARGAFLVTASLAALHVLATWFRPEQGVLREGLDGVLFGIQKGVYMESGALTTLCAHIVFLFLAMALSLRLARTFRQKVDSLTEDATRDPLTQLPNRRGFTTKMRGEIKRAERYAWPISFLVIDLDHFKQINDRHGHAFGDTVLSHAARLLRDAVGPVDHLARIGGEEFAVAAVAAEPTHGAELAQRVLRRFRDHAWDQLKPGLTVTCSIGVSVLNPGRTSVDPETGLSKLLDEADQSLYDVKQSGRNGYAVYGEDPVQTQIRPRPVLDEPEEPNPAETTTADDDVASTTSGIRPRRIYRSPRHR